MKRAVLSTIVLLTVFGSAWGAGEPALQPNIIYFMVDDMSYGDLSCFGQKHINTPAIDSLAEDGMVFRQAYAGGSWCAPSRTSLLTGLRPDHWSNSPPRGTSYPTLGNLMQKAGYTTAMFGKWHMKDRPDREKALISQRGFDRVLSAYNTPGISSDHFFHYPPEMMSDGKRISIEKNATAKLTKAHMWSYNQKDARKTAFDETGAFKDLDGSTDLAYAEHIYREAALEFMRRQHGKPFFIYYNPPSPHGPLNVKDLGRFWELEEADGGWNLARKSWARMIEEIDKTMELLLAELEKQGIAKNTLVIFTSDNGFSSWGYQMGRSDSREVKSGRGLDDPFFQHKGIPDKGGKFVNYNGGWHVPFIARWPEYIPAGKTTNRIVSFYDLMPTLAEFAEIEVPWEYDGVNVASIFKGKDNQQATRNALYFPDKGAAFPRHRDSKQDNPVQSVILDEKYFAYTIVADAKSENPTIRTFDMIADPALQHDLTETQPELADSLKKRARKVFAGE